MILVAGDIMLDVLLLPDLRSAEQPSGILVRSGGSAANTAAWIGYLGGEVTFVGCVGTDAVGRMLIAELEETGVRPAVRAVPGVETGAVADDISAEGERTMRSSRGANAALSPHDVRNAASGKLFAVHLTGYALLSPFGIEMLHAAAEVAERAGALLCFDPGSVGVIGAIGRERLLEEIASCRVGLLVPNAVEAMALAEAGEVREAVAQLAGRVPAVVVRDGPNGAFYSTGGVARHVPTVAIGPADTTGAGDGFNAGLLAALQRGLPLEEACAWGHRVARLVISRYGGRPIPGQDRPEALTGPTRGY